MRYKGYYHEQEEDHKTDMGKLKIRFIRNLKYSDLYARSEEEYKEWFEKLGQIMIRTDFHNRFEVKQVLGQGGFAKVYLARNLVDNQLYAVKAFRKVTLKKQTRGRAAVRNEVDVLQNISHPNIMKLIEVHETSNSLYLVCEYLAGGSLVEYLKKAVKFLSTEEILSIMM